MNFIREETENNKSCRKAADCTTNEKFLFRRKGFSASTWERKVIESGLSFVGFFNAHKDMKLPFGLDDTLSYS